MKKPTQRELMAAHNIARHNADLDTAAKASEADVPEIVDPNREPLPWPVTEDPFGGNDNNKRVAERIAKAQLALKSEAPAAPSLSPLEAALRDLKLSAQQSAEDGKPLTEEEQEQAAKDELAKAIAGIKTPPATPATPPVPVNPPAWTPKA